MKNIDKGSLKIWSKIKFSHNFHKIKKEYHDLFNSMLNNCAMIITNNFNIRFDKAQSYNLALPPTVYELLWRYEYISYKH